MTCTQPAEGERVSQRFTRTEVVRIAGIHWRQLDYWTRLRLVEPRGRWGERSYSFADLVALETIKQLTRNHIPARGLQRTIQALRHRWGENHAHLSELRVATNGRRVVVIAPAPRSQPLEPLTGQFVLRFETAGPTDKVLTMSSRSAEEWFEIGRANDSSRDTLERAAEAYQHAAELAPDWVDAHINRGTTLYQLQRMQEAKAAFAAATALEPTNALAHFNLSCALEQLHESEAAMEHLRRAINLAPDLADAHLNLAMAYSARGQMDSARRHLSLYLQYQPRGPWADFARSQMPPIAPPKPESKLTPFRRNR